MLFENVELNNYARSKFLFLASLFSFSLSYCCCLHIYPVASNEDITAGSFSLVTLKSKRDFVLSLGIETADRDLCEFCGFSSNWKKMEEKTVLSRANESSLKVNRVE